MKLGLGSVFRREHATAWLLTVGAVVVGMFLLALYLIDPTAFPEDPSWLVRP